MYKIAVVGDRDSIYGFATIGLDTFPVSDAESGERTLAELAATGYAIIYITEALAAEIPEEFEKYKEMKLPAVIKIPGVAGNTGSGMKDLKKLVEQAVGSDIIFGND